MLPSLHAFHQWAYGHNRIHHGHTIKLNADFVWHPVSPEEYQSFNLFQKLFIGFLGQFLEQGYTKLIFMPFLVWNYFIGFTVYVHHIAESIPWKYREDWSPFYGQVVGTVNYKVNPIYNIYIHSPHHIHIKIPFYNLPRALDEMKKEYKPFIQERKSLIKDYIKNTSKCKLMNFETGEWMTYKQAINFFNIKKFK